MSPAQWVVSAAGLALIVAVNVHFLGRPGRAGQSHTPSPAKRVGTQATPRDETR